jgi:hypothetical protein
MLLRMVLALVLVVAAAPASSQPTMTLTGKWRGSYSCLQGHTGLLITIEGPVGGVFTGEFSFFALDDNPKVPKGRFAIAGTYNPESGSVSMNGQHWIEQPPNYVMVDLSGKLSSDGRSIDGKVEYEGCTSFHVTLEGSPGPSTKAKGS